MIVTRVLESCADPPLGVVAVVSPLAAGVTVGPRPDVHAVAIRTTRQRLETRRPNTPSP